MACPALVPEITSDKQLTAILTDAHMGTRFHVQDAIEVAATLKGTRPGDSLADLLFSILLSPVLAEVQELEVSLGLAFGLSKSTDTLFATQDDPEVVLCTDVTFADDTAFMGVLPANLPPDEMLSLVHEWALLSFRIMTLGNRLFFSSQLAKIPLTTRKSWLLVPSQAG